jgi:hypothetical protein
VRQYRIVHIGSRDNYTVNSRRVIFGIGLMWVREDYGLTYKAAEEYVGRAKATEVKNRLPDRVVWQDRTEHANDPATTLVRPVEREGGK